MKWKWNENEWNWKKMIENGNESKIHHKDGGEMIKERRKINDD